MSSQRLEVSVLVSDQQLQDLQAIQDNVSNVPGDRLELLMQEGLIRQVGEASFVLTGVGASVLAADQTSEDKTLDKRLQAAGMIPVAELLRGAPLDGFLTHAGVHSLETFGQWLEMRRGEMLRMQARYDLGDKPMDDGLYEWITSHSAVFGEVHVNFKAAKAAPESGTSLH